MRSDAAWHIGAKKAPAMKANEHAATKRTVRSRHIRDVAGFPPIRLTQRDNELLTALAEYRLLTTSQIRKLFFRSLHRTRKRLFKLWQHKLVDRLFRPISLGERPSDVIYALAPLGARMLSRRKGFAEEAMPEARHVKKFSSLFLDHTLAVNDVRIALTLAIRHKSDWQFRDWREGKSIAEEVMFIDPMDGPAQIRLPLMADGSFCIRQGDRTQRCLVEVDLGTTTLRKIRRKLLGYSFFALKGIDQNRGGKSAFLVLWVASSRGRLRSLLSAAETIPSQRITSEIFRFTTLDNFVTETPEKPLGAIWYRPHGYETASTLFSISEATKVKAASDSV